jgi:hypothetical protein
VSAETGHSHVDPAKGGAGLHCARQAIQAIEAVGVRVGPVHRISDADDAKRIFMPVGFESRAVDLRDLAVGIASPKRERE